MKCCYKCQERILGCHDYCEKYKDFRKVIDKANKKRRIDNDFLGHTRYAAIRMKSKQRTNEIRGAR